ncbi:DUF2993 domain-containing protein [Streptomyces sp. NPDC091212]|uniref:LmeA family phospholipid-binding protein n=1 Tax=Streptomyces sp. NPDC091212 TaxID=3155191 RepID=UPI00343B8BAA
MRPPTRMPDHVPPSPPPSPPPASPLSPPPSAPRAPELPPNPYDELGQLATPEEEFAYDPRDPLDLGLAPDPADPDDSDDEWSPPNHRAGRRGLFGGRDRRDSPGRRDRRARRRFGSLPAALKATVAVLVCAAFLLLADRTAVLYAQDRAESQLQRSLGLVTRPAVDIHGFPFLTQVVSKRLDRVDVAVPHVAADRVSLAEVRAGAEDIRIEGGLPTSLTGAVIGKLDGRVLLAFDDLGRELGASQVKFTDNGAGSVRIDGSLPLAGTDLRLRAVAHIRRDGDRAVSTVVDGIRLDIPGVATYRPGKDRAHSGLRLAPEAATRIAEEKDRARALLEVPAVVERLGVPQARVREALRGEDELARLTGTPHFARKLMGLNLIDVVADHPELLREAGLEPGLVEALLDLRPPELSDSLSLSFTLPKTPGDLRLRHITVERDGIHARLVGSELRVGRTP